MGVRVGTLDAEVEKARPRKPGEDGAPDPFETVEPWPERVDGAALLDALRAEVLRFCVLPPYSAEVMAVWGAARLGARGGRHFARARLYLAREAMRQDHGAERGGGARTAADAQRQHLRGGALSGGGEARPHGADR